MTEVDIGGIVAEVELVSRSSSFIVGKVEMARFRPRTRPRKKEKKNNTLLKLAINLLGRGKDGNGRNGLETM